VFDLEYEVYAHASKKRIESYRSSYNC